VKEFPNALVLSAVLAVGTIYAWVRIAPELSPSEMIQQNSLDDSDQILQTHLDSLAMISAGDQATGRPAPEFVASASDGKIYRLSEIVRDRPAVLVFIKDGCPCSRAADPFFRRLQTAGCGFMPFFGVIDGRPIVAARWTDQTGTAFPILADPELKIIHAYGAESSAYVAFVGKGGRIEKLWAGYSESMLNELGERMQPWVKPGMGPYDVSDAPRELYSGCSY
jgi:peroxiredoxin